MWHIYFTTPGVFEFAFVHKGRYIAGSRQGYARKKTALKSLWSLISISSHSAMVTLNNVQFKVQDDTMDEPLMATVDKDGVLHWTGQKPGKAYEPVKIRKPYTKRPS